MARQKFEKSFNTFVKGLMTEASEINFPENYSLYEKNFELRRDGGRDRRRGMDLLYPLGQILTSRPYPLEFGDSLDTSPTNIDVKLMMTPVDTMTVGVTDISIQVVDQVRYLEYDNYPPESLSVSVEGVEVSRVDFVRYLEYDNYPPESLQASVEGVEVSRRTVAAYLDYSVLPENLDVSVTNVEVQRRDM